MISPSQRPLPDNTQHSQQTNIYASGGIQTHDCSRRAAVDLCLRPRGYWDRRTSNHSGLNVPAILCILGTCHLNEPIIPNIGGINIFDFSRYHDMSSFNSVLLATLKYCYPVTQGMLSCNYTNLKHKEINSSMN